MPEPFPYTLDQLNTALDHDPMWNIPPKARLRIMNEVGAILHAMCIEHDIPFEPTSDFGRAVVASLGVSFHMGLETGYLLAQQT